jgi:preprotein translocase subunit SecF
MYRRTLIMLWAGTIVFGAAAIADAFIDFMKNAQGLLIGAFAMMFVGAILHIGLHRLNETAKANGQRAEELLELSETKTAQVRADVDQLRCQMNEIRQLGGETRDWAEAAVLMKQAEKNPPEPEPDGKLAVVHQFRLRGQHGDAIVGNRTGDLDNHDEILAFLEQNEIGTLPGRHSAS